MRRGSRLLIRHIGRLRLHVGPGALLLGGTRLDRVPTEEQRGRGGQFPSPPHRRCRRRRRRRRGDKAAAAGSDVRTLCSSSSECGASCADPLDTSILRVWVGLNRSRCVHSGGAAGLGPSA